MFLLGYRCTGCSRAIDRSQVIESDGPLGPQWECPACGSAVLLRASRWLIALYAVAVAGLALLYGCWIGVGN